MDFDLVQPRTRSIGNSSGRRGKGLLALAVATLLLALSACYSFPKPNPDDAETAWQIFEVRQGTFAYLKVERAKDDGYAKGSGYIPRQGYQYYNPRYLSVFDLRHPPILLYDERDGRWQLLGAMYAVPRSSDPTRAIPFKRAEFLQHDAMCHYEDGTIILGKSPESCPKEHPLTRAAFEMWHPDLWLVAVWAWTPNSNGVFALFNPYLQAPVRP